MSHGITPADRHYTHKDSVVNPKWSEYSPKHEPLKSDIFLARYLVRNKKQSGPWHKIGVACKTKIGNGNNFLLFLFRS